MDSLDAAYAALSCATKINIGGVVALVFGLLAGLLWRRGR